MTADLGEIVSRVGRQGAEKEAEEAKQVQVLVFSVDKEEYAAEITELEEIIKLPEITPLPNAPEYVEGIFNLRGRIIVAINLEKRLNLVRESGITPRHIIVLSADGTGYGIIVDEVAEVLRVPAANIQQSPQLASVRINTEYLKGVILSEHKKEPAKGEKGLKDNTRLIILMDIKKMLRKKELEKLSKEINNQ